MSSSHEKLRSELTFEENAKGQPIDNFLSIKKSQKILSIFHMTNPNPKSKAPVTKSFVIVCFVTMGICLAVSDHLRRYTSRPAAMNIIIAKTI